ncbi:HNH endonuclease [Roseovarius sp. S1116L3]|uniref:HNH endonuclease n=1 Tax=Roseovarius roseus TaxID=3342636 RepID=UPI00372CC302
MNRYLIKINGEKRCPQQISRPAGSTDWEGGEVLLEANSPVLARPGSRQEAPTISEGDELWIWTHEDENFGKGWGLTAKAKAGRSQISEGEVALQLNNVERLDRPFGFKVLGTEPTGSRLIDYLRTYRHHLVFLIEDDDYPDFVALAERHGTFPAEFKQPYETEWGKYIKENKREILQDLSDRRLSFQKARPGQGQFRAALFEAYGGRCALTRCSVPQALEAAHVLPHNGNSVRDQTDNGLLLRRDLHAMFDDMLWSIDPKTSKVCLSRQLNDKSYAGMDGLLVNHHVAQEPLRVHFIQFQNTNKDF